MLYITLEALSLNGEPILCAKWEEEDGEAIPFHLPALRGLELSSIQSPFLHNLGKFD